LTDSWKRAAVFGLASGLVAGLVAYGCYLILLGFELPLPWYELFPEGPFKNYAEFYIVMNLFWGPIYGILFSKAYAAIPAKKIFKGLCFGFVIFLFSAVRDGVFWVPYAAGHLAISWMFIAFFSSIVYGILLGILYKKDVEPVGKFDVGKGFLVGALAGIIGGILAFFVAIPVNIWYYGFGEKGFEIAYLTNLAVNHITINGFWSVIFGIVYTKVYNLVPGKNTLKGLVYGLIIFLMASGHWMSYLIAMGDYRSAIQLFLIGITQVMVFGLVLGLLYRKPKEAPTKKKEKIRTVQIVNCIHCNAAITKGSKYCNECGKKQ
jgi:hypothetical protein